MRKINPDTSLETVSGCPEQTVVRRGSLVFCVSKSSEAERERMEPQERNERVCAGHPDTSSCHNGKSGINNGISAACYPLRTDRGFTLLEVLVALAILGIAVTLVLQLFSANLRNIAISEDYVSATVTAEARMREVLDDEALKVSNWNEITDDGYRIDVVVADALQQRTGELPVRLLEVALTINWTQNKKQKSLTLRTMKMIERKI